MELIKQIQPIVALLLSFCTLVGIIIAIYKFSAGPDEKNKTKLKLMEQRCKLQHKGIDSDIRLIKENHLKHIEANMDRLDKNMTKVFTILEERLPRK